MNGSLRILMLLPQLGYGGAESSFQRLADFLGNHSSLTIGLMSTQYGSADYSNDHRSVSHRLVLLDETGSKGGGLIGKVIRWRRMLRRLRALKSEHDITISFLSGPNLLNALSGMPLRTIVSERGSKLYHRGIPRLRRLLWLSILDPITYRRAGKIVPASIGYSREIAQIGGAIIRSKIVPIEGGIDSEDLLSAADEPPDSDIVRFCQRPTAVYSGRLDVGKGIDLLLPAFAKVRSIVPESRLLLIGDGPQKNKIIAICQSLGVSVTTTGDPESAVFVAGYRAKPIRHFRHCNVFVFPSLHEGLGNSLIEGVASGIPVIASDCCWGPRSILSGGTLQYEGPDPELPSLLRHGILMPLPDTAKALQVWTDQIASALSQVPRPRPSRADRLVAIARYDIAQTGPRWLELARGMAQEAGRR